MFPLDHRGQFSRSKDSIPDVRDFVNDFQFRATRALEVCRARNIKLEGGRVSFTAGLFRLVTNNNILSAISYGHIDIAEADDHFVVSYYISFVQLVVMNTLVVVLFFGGILFLEDTGEMLFITKVLIMVLAWFGLSVLNWLPGVYMFHSLVKSMTRGGNRIEPAVGPQRG